MAQSAIEFIESIVKTTGDLYIGTNNASVALGGFELSLKNVIEIGGRVNQSLVALNRVTGMYGKTANELSAQTAALAKQFYVPFEKLLSIQQKLAADLPIAITRQRELVSVLQFAADRFGNTEQGIEGYIGALESLSSKSHLAYQDQMLLISSAERLRKAQQEGGAAASAASAAYAKQSAITRDNAQIMYITGEISRDEYATILRTTEALSDQNKTRLQTVESTSRASNELRNSQVSMFEAISTMDEFNEFYKGLQVVPGMLAASLTSKMTAKGMEFFDVEHIDTQSDEVQEVFKSFADSAQAAMKKAASEGKTYEEAISEINKEMEKEGPIAAKAFEAFLQQEGAVKSLKSNWADANKAQEQRMFLEQLVAKLLKDGNVEEYRRIQAQVASLAVQRAMMEVSDAMRLALQRSVEQAKNYNDLMQSTVALAETQLDVLSRIRDSGESIGDASEIQAKNTAEILDAASKEYQLLQVSAAIRRDMAASAKAIQAASGEEKRKAAIDMVVKAEQSAEEARKAAAEAIGTAEQEQMQRQAEMSAEAAKHIKQLYEQGKLDEQAAFAAKQAAEGKKAENAAQQAYKKGLEESLRLSTLLGEQAEKFAARRVDLARSELDLLDSVASGIGASASARAAAAAEQGKVVKAMEEQMAGAERDRRDKEALLELDKQLLAQAQARGDQEAINAAQTKVGQTAAAIQAAEQKILETTAKRNGALKTQLELTKQIREGYLDALSAMSEGAGVFAEIIVDQSKNLGTLLRTAKDMPTSLRTGSNTGSGAGISQFTAGGLDAGEWTKDMAEYTNDLVSDQIPKIIEHLSNIANRPTGDMASLNANRLGVLAEGGGTSAPSAPVPKGSAPASPAPSTAAGPSPAPAGSPSPNADSVAPAIEKGFTNVQATWGADLGKAVAAAEGERAKLVAELNRFAVSSDDQISKMISGLNGALVAAKQGSNTQDLLATLQNQIAALTDQLSNSQRAAKQAADSSVKAAGSAPSAVVEKTVAVSAQAGEPATTTPANPAPSPAPVAPAAPLTIDMLTSAVQVAHERVLGSVGKDLSSIRDFMSGVIPHLDELRKTVEASNQVPPPSPQQVVAAQSGLDGQTLKTLAAEAYGIHVGMAQVLAQLKSIQDVVAGVQAAAQPSVPAGSPSASYEMSALLAAASEAAGSEMSVQLASLGDIAISIRDHISNVESGLSDIAATATAARPPSGGLAAGSSKPEFSSEIADVTAGIVSSIDACAILLAKLDYQLGKTESMKSEPSIAPVFPPFEIDTSTLASAFPSEILDSIALRLDAIGSQLAAQTSANVVVDIQAAEPSASKVDFSPIVAVVQDMPELPIDLVERVSKTLDVLAAMGAKSEPAPLSVEMTAPEMPPIDLDVSGIVAAVQAIPQLPLDTLEGLAAAVAKLSAVPEGSPENNVYVDVTAPEMPPIDLDVSGIVAAVQAIPQLPLDTLEGLAAAVAKLSAVPEGSPENNVYVDVKASEPPAVNVDLSQIEELVRSVPVGFGDVVNQINGSLQVLMAMISRPAAVPVDVEVKAAENPVVNVDLAQVAESISSIPSIPLDTMERMVKALETLAFITPESSSPEVKVNVESAAAPKVDVDLSTVAAAIQEIPQLPLSMIEGMTKAVEALLSREMAAAAPTISVQTPEISLPAVSVDTSGIEQAIKAMPVLPTSLLEGIDRGIGMMAAALDSRVEPSVSVDVAAPAPSPIEFDLTPIAEAINAIPQFPLSLLEGLGRSLDALAYSSDRNAQPEVAVNVTAPSVEVASPDFSPLIEAMKSLTTSPREIADSFKASLDALVKQSALAAAPKAEVAMQTAEVPDISANFSPLIDAVASSSLRTEVGTNRIIDILEAYVNSAATRDGQIVQVNVDVPPPREQKLDLDGLLTAISDMPSIPEEHIASIKRSTDILVDLAYAQSGKSAEVEIPVAPSPTEGRQTEQTPPASPMGVLETLADLIRKSSVDSTALLASSTETASLRMESLVSSVIGRMQSPATAEAPAVKVSVEGGQVPGVTGEESASVAVSNRLSDLNAIFTQTALGMANLIAQVSSTNMGLADLSSQQSKNSQDTLTVSIPDGLTEGIAAMQRAMVGSVSDSIVNAGVIARDATSDSLENLGNKMSSSIATIADVVAGTQKPQTPSRREPDSGAAYLDQFEQLSKSLSSFSSEISIGLLGLKDAVASSPEPEAVVKSVDTTSSSESRFVRMVGEIAAAADSLGASMQDGAKTSSGIMTEALDSVMADFQSAAASLMSMVNAGNAPQSPANTGTASEAPSIDFPSLERSIGASISDNLLVMSDQMRRVGDAISAYALQGAPAESIQVDVAAPSPAQSETAATDFSPITAALDGYAKSTIESSSYLIDKMQDSMRMILEVASAPGPAPAVSVSPVVNVQSPGIEPQSAAPGEGARSFSYPELLSASVEGFGGLLSALGQMSTAATISNSLLTSIGSSLANLDISPQGAAAETGGEKIAVDFGTSSIVDGLAGLAASSSADMSRLIDRVSGIGDTIKGMSAVESAPVVVANPQMDVDFSDVVISIDSLGLQIASQSTAQGLNNLASSQALDAIQANTVAAAERVGRIVELLGNPSPTEKETLTNPTLKVDFDPLLSAYADSSERMIEAIRAEAKVIGDVINKVGIREPAPETEKTKSSQLATASLSKVEMSDSFSSSMASYFGYVQDALADFLQPLFEEEPQSNVLPPSIIIPKVKVISENSEEAAGGASDAGVSAPPRPGDNTSAREVKVQQQMLLAKMLEISLMPIGIPASFFTDLQNATSEAVANSSNKAGAPKFTTVEREIVSAMDSENRKRASATQAKAPSSAEKSGTAQRPPAAGGDGVNIDALMKMIGDVNRMIAAASSYTSNHPEKAEKLIDAIEAKNAEIAKLVDNLASKQARRESSAANSAGTASENSARQPGMARESVTITMPDGFVRSLSSQVAEMTKAQVVPAIVDGFAQAIRQGFSA